MPSRPLSLLAALILGAAPLGAQELSDLRVETNPPIQGDLLIHAGSFLAGRSLVPYGECPEGEAGRRQQLAQVVFDPPFQQAPQVVVALNGLNFGQGRDEPARGTRVIARAQEVTRRGMVVVVETWCDTNLYGVQGSYFAMGPSGGEIGGLPVPPTPVERPPEPIERPSGPIDDATLPEPTQPAPEGDPGLPDEW